MLKNLKFKELARQYIAKYSLNLEGYNVLVPAIAKEPMLPGIIAGMAGADTIYVYDESLDINKSCQPLPGEHNFTLKLIGSVSHEVLNSVNIVVKNSKMPLKDDKLGSMVKKDAVVAMLPDDLDFTNARGINLQACQEKNINIIGLNPEDEGLSLYKHFGQQIIKRCHKLGLDVCSSKILLIGNGSLLDATLSLLKACGAIVYVYNTGVLSDQSHVLKHLKGLDAIVVMDYPLSKKQIIGIKGIVPIPDIIDSCPLVKIIHIAGKIETGALKLGNIAYSPENAEQDSLSLEFSELGERGMTEIITASLKASEEFLENRKNGGKNTLNFNSPVITYKLLGSKIDLLLGGKV